MIRLRNDCGKTVINLDGPEGTAFQLLAYASRFAKDMGYVSDLIPAAMTMQFMGKW